MQGLSLLEKLAIYFVHMALPYNLQGGLERPLKILLDHAGHARQWLRQREIADSGSRQCAPTFGVGTGFG